MQPSYQTSNNLLIHRAVQESINNVCLCFKKNKDYFLTEEDMRSHLFNKMLRKRILKTETRTQSETISIPVHSEIRWYGDNGRMKYRSDIVVLQVNNLETNSHLELPSKGFKFNKFDAVIELKLRRVNGESDSAFLKKIKNDFKKPRQIKHEVQNFNSDAKYYLVIFDKKKLINNIENEIEDPYPTNEVKIFYEFAC